MFDQVDDTAEEALTHVYSFNLDKTKEFRPIFLETTRTMSIQLGKKPNITYEICGEKISSISATLSLEVI